MLTRGGNNVNRYIVLGTADPCYFGFEIEGTLRDFALRDGPFVDAYAMARLRRLRTCHRIFGTRSWRQMGKPDVAGSAGR